MLHNPVTSFSVKSHGKSQPPSKSINQFASLMDDKAEDVDSCRKILDDWLTEYKSLSDSALGSYAEQIMKNDGLLHAFEYAIFEREESSLKKYITPVCHQLFNFFRSEYKQLRLYAVGFFPALIGGYFHNHLPMGHISEHSSSVSTMILSIYGLMCNDASDKLSMNLSGPKTATIVPNLSKSSAYHDATIAPFTENMLNPSKTQSFLVRVSDTENYSKITAYNRAKIFGVLMTSYFDWVAELQNASLGLVCRVCHYLASRGYPWQKLYLFGKSHENFRRLKLEADIVLPFLQSVHFALYNNQERSAKDATEAMLLVANLKLEAKVMTMCKAMLSSWQHEKRSQSAEPFLSNISTTVTPRLKRANSRLRAATAQSIRSHKWRHQSEDVSADYMPARDVTSATNVLSAGSSGSQQQANGGGKHFSLGETSTNLATNSAASSAVTDGSSKSPATPIKSIKNKIKKNMPSYQSVTMSKTKSKNNGVEMTKSNGKSKKKSTYDAESKAQQNQQQQQSGVESEDEYKCEVVISQSSFTAARKSIDDEKKKSFGDSTAPDKPSVNDGSAASAAAARLNGGNDIHPPSPSTTTTTTAAMARRPNSIKIASSPSSSLIRGGSSDDEGGDESEALLPRKGRPTTADTTGSSSFDHPHSKHLLFADESSDGDDTDGRRCETTIL